MTGHLLIEEAASPGDVNPKILLVFEDNAWTGYSENGVLLPRPLSLPNTVYSWNLYLTTWKRGEGAPPGARRPGQGVEDAAWIGEFNAFNHANDADHPADWQDQLAEYMAYAKSNDIGWTIWEYGHGRNSGIVDKKGKRKTELIAGLQEGF